LRMNNEPGAKTVSIVGSWSNASRWWANEERGSVETSGRLASHFCWLFGICRKISITPACNFPSLQLVTNGPLVAFKRFDMTLKIEKTVDGHRTTVRLIGRVQAEDLPEVTRQLEASGKEVVLRLDDVTLVDVDVVRFLNRCETEGMRLVDCSPYIRMWMSREQKRSWPGWSINNEKQITFGGEHEMAKTYKAVEVAGPGNFRIVERPITPPSDEQVLIRVEACGICHTDSLTVEGQFPGLSFPRVPGHEVAGRIEAIGSSASQWRVGQRVGVGFFGGYDGHCELCRRGDFINCQNLTIPGIGVDGGYAEMMLADANAVVSIPDLLKAVDAAPLLCAGVTTYNALRNAPLRSGDLVAVQGIGGLGHLGIQFARRMGFRTVAIARGVEKGKLAKELGASSYINAETEDPAAALQRMGGAKVILATAASSSSMGPLIAGLAPRGRLIVLGASAEPIQVDAVQLLFGARSIEGSLTGTAIDIEDTLAFSVLQNVRPIIEMVPLERAAEAYARMMRGEARFRIVLTTRP
jgi:2-desacetyl-2-hydroxyethyl bacteriochlorophyllide A dehydrogenase